jgi:hypothetical protein
MKLFVVIAMACSLPLTHHAFAQSASLPGAGGSVCDFVAANVGREIGPTDEQAKSMARWGYGFERPFSDFLVKAAAADIDGDGDIEFMTVGGEMGTARGDNPELFGVDKWPSDLRGGDFGEDARWSYGARFLNFKGDWNLIYFRDEELQQATTVVKLTGGVRVACGFEFGFDEKVTYGKDDPEVRAEFEKRQPWRHGSHWDNSQLAGAPISAQDRRYIMTLGKFREVEGGLVGEDNSRWLGVNTATALIMADVDADGNKERIARFSYSSSAGRGCDAQFVDLLPDEGQSAPDPELRGRILYAQGGNAEEIYSGACGYRSEVVEIDGRGYIYVERGGASDPKRRMVAIGAGIVAQSEFTPRHTVTFDLTKDGAMKRPN